jgi:hypothetical protein
MNFAVSQMDTPVFLATGIEFEITGAGAQATGMAAGERKHWVDTGYGSPWLLISFWCLSFHFRNSNHGITIEFPIRRLGG